MAARSWAGVAAALFVLAGCSGSNKAAAPTTTTGSTTTTTSAGAGGTSVPSSATLPVAPVQAKGPRTVLSPVGVNVRSSASTSAPIAGTAAEGTVLTVLGHTTGWYQVMGSTVTGYITDDPTLSASGMFQSFSSGDGTYSLLYPTMWTAANAAPTSEVFHPPTGDDSIVVTTATSTGLLVRGRDGYEQDSDTAVVVCGVTGDLLVFSAASPAPPTSGSQVPGVTSEQYLIQLHLTLDATHALGIDANLANLATLTTVEDVFYSMTFPFPQCEQGATGPTPTTAVPATVF